MKKSKLKDEASLLKQISKVNPKKAASFFKKAPKETVDCVSQCCFNIVNYGFPLNDKTSQTVKRKLMPIKKDIRELSNPKVSLKRKRKILSKQQVGRGLISILASTLLPILISALSA